MENSEIKGTGLVHLYFGDGKGKTTTGMGLCVRAAGCGYKVLIYQFMKNNSTSERKAMEKMDNIRFVDGQEHVKFSFLMKESEREEQKVYYEQIFRKLIQIVQEEHFQVLFLDEVVNAIRTGLFDENALLDFLAAKPDDLEVILSGREPDERLLNACDYASEIRKVRHPYDRGQNARKGIEF